MIAIIDGQNVEYDLCHTNKSDLNLAVQDRELSYLGEGLWQWDGGYRHGHFWKYGLWKVEHFKFEGNYWEGCKAIINNEMVMFDICSAGREIDETQFVSPLVYLGRGSIHSIRGVSGAGLVGYRHFWRYLSK